MKVKDIMTKQVVCCLPSDSVQGIAKLMKAHDVRAVLVVSDLTSGRLVGIITDRDLCCAVLADGKPYEVVCAREVMTAEP